MKNLFINFLRITFIGALLIASHEWVAWQAYMTAKNDLTNYYENKITEIARKAKRIKVKAEQAKVKAEQDHAIELEKFQGRVGKIRTRDNISEQRWLCSQDPYCKESTIGGEG